MSVIIDGPEGVLTCNDENNPIKTDNKPPTLKFNHLCWIIRNISCHCCWHN